MIRRKKFRLVISVIAIFLLKGISGTFSVSERPIGQILFEFGKVKGGKRK